MGYIKRVSDIMHPIEEYSTISYKEKLCEALRILKENYEIAKSKTGETHEGRFL